MHASHKTKSLLSPVHPKKDASLVQSSNASAAKSHEGVKILPARHKITQGPSLGVMLGLTDAEFVRGIVGVVIDDVLGVTELDAITEGLVDGELLGKVVDVLDRGVVLLELHVGNTLAEEIGVRDGDGVTLGVLQRMHLVRSSEN